MTAGGDMNTSPSNILIENNTAVVHIKDKPSDKYLTLCGILILSRDGWRIASSSTSAPATCATCRKQDRNNRMDAALDPTTMLRKR